MREPQEGVPARSFSYRKEAPGAPGTTRIFPGQVDAATSTSADVGSPERSRSAAALAPAWHPAVAQEGLKMAASRDGRVGEQAGAPPPPAPPGCSVPVGPVQAIAVSTAVRRKGKDPIRNARRGDFDALTMNHSRLCPTLECT
jgi:hypothetical protein